MFENTYSGIDEIVTRVISVMMLYGAATEHPELIPTDYASPTDRVGGRRRAVDGVPERHRRPARRDPRRRLLDPRSSCHQPARFDHAGQRRRQRGGAFAAAGAAGTADSTVGARAHPRPVRPAVRHRSGHRVLGVRGRRPPGNIGTASAAQVTAGSQIASPTAAPTTRARHLRTSTAGR